MQDKILIVNDLQDCGVSYGAFFSSFGGICHDPASFKLQAHDFKLVVFTGGPDVIPDLYGDTYPRGICRCDKRRDREEVGIYRFAHQKGIKMVGICRGMQFLNVMNGGKLIHDLNGHGSGAHKIMTRDRDEPFLVNSFHHQMSIPHEDTHILAWSHVKLSKDYIGDKDEVVDYRGPEVEAIYVVASGCVGVQWHPEAMPGSGDWAVGSTWFKFVVKDLLEKNTMEFKRLYLGSNYSKIFIAGT